MEHSVDLERTKIFIEVASGEWAWTDKLLDGENKRGLKAPASTRYFNLFKQVSPGDIVLTHLTNSLTQKKGWRSAIVGISTIAGECYKNGNMIFFETTNDIEFPEPIKFSEYKELDIFSEAFSKAIRMSLQKYLINITSDDFKALLKVHPDNEIFLKNDVNYRQFIEK